MTRRSPRRTPPRLGAVHQGAPRPPVGLCARPGGKRWPMAEPAERAVHRGNRPAFPKGPAAAEPVERGSAASPVALLGTREPRPGQERARRSRRGRPPARRTGSPAPPRPASSVRFWRPTSTHAPATRASPRPRGRTSPRGCRARQPASASSSRRGCRWRRRAGRGSGATWPRLALPSTGGRDERREGSTREPHERYAIGLAYLSLGRPNAAGTMWRESPVTQSGTKCSPS